MEDRFRTKEFQNWMKCVSAQIETVKALYGVVELLWKGYISCLTKEERDQIETFVECVEFAKIKYLKKDQQPFCDHEACVWLLKKLLKLLHNTSLPEKYYASTLPSSDSFFNAYWHIAKLFLTVEDESVTNGGLKALDIYHLSKMMNACQLFAFVGSAEAYNTICEDRDILFHTSDYNISDGQRRSILENLSNVLSHFCNDRLKTCSYIRANIQQNQEKDWLTEYEFGYTKVVRQMLECKIAALELDLHIQESQPLREVLENTVKLHETIDNTSNENPGEQRDELLEMENLKDTTLPIEKEEKDLDKCMEMGSLKKKIKKDEYRNWVKRYLGLERTNRALYGYVEKKFALFTHKRVGPGVHFTQDEFDHIHGGQGCIRTSLTTKIKYSREMHQWIWKTKCNKCTSVFDKILSLHRKPTEKGIHWQNSHDTSNIPLDWAIAKMFMPEGNEKNTGPGDTDMSAMISMMLNCKLFINCIRPDHLKELRIARNDLFHSTDNLISGSKMETYFNSMREVLADASNDNDVDKKISRTIKEDIDKVEKLKESEMMMTLFDDALKIKGKAIYEGYEMCLSINDLDQLKLLEKSLCFFWQAFRDSVYALDNRGRVICVFIAIGLAILLRFLYSE